MKENKFIIESSAIMHVYDYHLREHGNQINENIFSQYTYFITRY